MDLKISPQYTTRSVYSWVSMFAISTFLLPGSVPADVLFSDDFSNSTQVDNRWSCVDGRGQIKAIRGSQLAVDDSGNINNAFFAPSVAVGDLNGDGLPDLVVADSFGFFWYFPNHGTKDEPKFTTSEIMPIWFGDPCPSPWGDPNLVPQNIVPRIQLIDLDGSGKLDLVVGNFAGKLFYLHNSGTASSPVFRMPQNLDDITVPTCHKGKLWCNYLAPFLYDWHSNGVLDLLLGDGSYSANSIYLLVNKGSRNQPTFNEENTFKIIPGMGREELIPQVVSWNGDGKADVLTTEREGFLNIFLNQGSDPDTGTPKFDRGQHVIVGGLETLGEHSTVTMAKLTATGLPGLIIATQDGHLSFSKNTGNASSYEFGVPAPLNGINTRPPVLRPTGWSLEGGFGSPYDLLVCTNAQVEAGFKPPPDSGVTSALRFYIDEPAKPNPTFPEHFQPVVNTRLISRAAKFNLMAETSYKLSFWVRSDGNLSNVKYLIFGNQYDASGNILGSPSMSEAITPSSNWNKFTTDVRFESLSDDRHAIVNFGFALLLDGKGSLYISGLTLESE